MDLLGLGLLLIVGLGLVLGTVIMLTRGIFARDLTHALKRVEQQEQELQEKAEALGARINQMEREYQVKLTHAQTEADRLLQEAKQQAFNVRTAAVEEAKHRARQLWLEAEQGKTQWKTDAMKELNGQAIRRACESLRDLLPQEAAAALHQRLVTELLGALAQLDVLPDRTGVERVEVDTAQPLSAAQAQHLERWIQSVVGAGVPLHTHTDPALVAGCVVRFGATIVDNTLVNQLGRRA